MNRSFQDLAEGTELAEVSRHGEHHKGTRQISWKWTSVVILPRETLDRELVQNGTTDEISKSKK